MATGAAGFTLLASLMRRWPSGVTNSTLSPGANDGALWAGDRTGADTGRFAGAGPVLIGAGGPSACGGGIAADPRFISGCSNS